MTQKKNKAWGGRFTQDTDPLVGGIKSDPIGGGRLTNLVVHVGPNHRNRIPG